MLNGKNRPPVRRHHFLRNLFIILFLIIAIPVALVYGFFFDTARHNANIEEADFSVVAEKALFDSFDNTANTGTIDFAINQETLNKALKKGYNTLDGNVRNYVDGLYIEINGNEYVFYVEAKAPLFSTRAIITTTLEDQVDQATPINGAFIFRIKEVKLGRLPGIDNIAMTFAGNQIRDALSNLETTLSNNGFHMSINADDRTLTYQKANLRDDLVKLVGSQELAGAALSEFLVKGLFSLDDSKKDSIAFKIDITSLHDNPQYVDPNNDLNVDLPSYVSQVKTVLATLPETSGHQSEIFTYLIEGYSNVSSDIQDYVRNLDLSCINIENPVLYRGEDFSKGEALSNIITEQINIHSIQTEHKIADISESNLNSFLAASGIIGKGTVLKSAENKLVYITIDNLNCNILNDTMYIILGLNVNGYETRVILDTAYQTFEDYKLTLAIREIFIGKQAPSKEFRNEIDRFLVESLSSEKMISYNASEGTIVLDVLSSIANSHLRDAIELVGTPVATLSGENLTDQSAKISLAIKPNFSL